MSDTPVYDEEEGLLGLETEDDRDVWIDFILDSDEWIQAQVIYDDDGNMVLRCRWPDGNEIVFDAMVRRKFEVVIPEPEGKKN